MKQKIKLIITEDQPVMRTALKSLLENYKEFEIIGEASNGRELLDLLKDKTPDVVLLDLRMPIMNGCETLEIINKRFKNVRVIMLSMHDEFDTIVEILSKGARGFVSKNGQPEHLVKAIHEVFKNGHYFDKNISEAMLNGLLKEKSINPLFDEQALSERETQVMKGICDGLTNNCIAGKLNISPSTVDFHKRNIYKKTKSRNVADLLKYAIKYGMIVIN